MKELESSKSDINFKINVFNHLLSRSFQTDWSFNLLSLTWLFIGEFILSLEVIKLRTVLILSCPALPKFSFWCIALQFLSIFLCFFLVSSSYFYFLFRVSSNFDSILFIKAFFSCSCFICNFFNLHFSLCWSKFSQFFLSIESIWFFYSWIVLASWNLDYEIRTFEVSLNFFTFSKGLRPLLIHEIRSTKTRFQAQLVSSILHDSSIVFEGDHLFL